MGLFGGNDKRKKRVLRAQPVIRRVPKINDDNPWQQSLGQAKNTRSKFWNNIKTGVAGQSWNKKTTVAKPKAKPKPKRRRRH